MRTLLRHIDLHPSDQAERASFFENNDCTVVALAAAVNIPYAEAREILAKAGRKPRQGFKSVTWLNNQCFNARMKGSKFRIGKYAITRIAMPYHSVTVARFLRDFPKGRFLCRQRGHLFTIIDGRVLNLLSGARTRITNLWHVTEEI
jgi:hypothetical protein